MKLGLIGAGNMGASLARGLGLPLGIYDVDRGRADELAAAVGGSVAESSAALAEGADAIVLAHKPTQLAAVAREVGAASTIISILGGTSTADIEAAYPGAAVHRFMPNIAAEVGRAVLCYAPGARVVEAERAEVVELFSRAGLVIEIPEHLMEAATGLMGCSPAFFALVAEALVDAGVRQGLTPEVAARMVVETMAGTAAALERTGDDTQLLRRRVTSPGGSTARGLAALERGGVRAAFDDAVTAAAGRNR